MLLESDALGIDVVHKTSKHFVEDGPVVSCGMVVHTCAAKIANPYSVSNTPLNENDADVAPHQ